MKWFPVSLNLEGRSVLVIGGGTIASRRVGVLDPTGARITVVAEEPSFQIVEWSRSGRLKLHRRKYAPDDLNGMDFVLTATDDPAVNHAAWESARARRIPINVTDDPEKCDFIIPALVERGDLSIAISTNGRSPALAARLRRRFSAMLGPEYARLVDVLDRARRRLGSRDLGFDEKRAAMYRLVDSDILRLVRENDTDAIERRIDAVVDSAGHGAGDPASLGMVYIVGAGPGDPGLLTVRGLECLHAADVVLHDRLIDGRVLDEARRGARIVDVGKRLGQQEQTQDFIHRTMVDEARAGRTVCRLKGGDPFVFGRGGEEARALIEADVPFEIIPGVTSAVAVPAAAGIPVTHREAAHAFMVMTGSRANNAAEEEWAGAVSLLAGGGTLVVLMGLAHLALIVDRLVDCGCPPATPAAIVSRGTFADQDVRVGVVGNIKEKAGGAKSPAVIVLGAVVREREELDRLRNRILGSRPD
jgi:uroporphyrin-III C-methyltransferase/precorrin-2 dehydrogenase/sirohydrochlorin ferrochelatase